MQQDQFLPGEVLLMPNQANAFNGDHFVQTEFLKLKKQFGINTVVETGTCVGGTAKWFGENFDRVFTTEISEQYRNVALQRIGNMPNVTSLLGDSVEMLVGEVLKKCDDKTIVFLDAHWNFCCPLRDELQAIADFKLKPVIVIHDFVVPGRPDLGYDSINGQPFTFEWLKDKFDAIYGESGYDYYYNSEATEIKRGLIYLMPKVKLQTKPNSDVLSSEKMAAPATDKKSQSTPASKNRKPAVKSKKETASNSKKVKGSHPKSKSKPKSKTKVTRGLRKNAPKK